MLEMIFENSNLSDYYCISKSKQNNDKKYSVEIVKYQHVISIDDEPDWGYYIDLDNETLPNKKYLKNKKKSSSTLDSPQKKYITNKPINYLPPIEEGIFHTNNNIKSYIMDDISTASSVVSVISFCATIAFYYFYRNIRN